MLSDYPEISQIKRLSEPLYRVKGWMKFAGVLSIITGALQALSIWGIVIAWLPIWMGAVLYSASNHIQKAYETEQEQDMVTSLGKLGKYFKIFGIFTLVLMAVAVIGIIAAILIPTFIRSRQGMMPS